MKNTIDNTEMSISEKNKSIIQRHLTSFIENDLDVLLSDYVSDSILITQEATYSGPAEIRKFFIGIMAHFPYQKSSLDLDNMTVNGEVGYIVWHGKSQSVNVPFATDTFVMKNGKIHQQTFAGQLNLIGLM